MRRVGSKTLNPADPALPVPLEPQAPILSSGALESMVAQNKSPP